MEGTILERQKPPVSYTHPTQIPCRTLVYRVTPTAVPQSELIRQLPITPGKAVCSLCLVKLSARLKKKKKLVRQPAMLGYEMMLKIDKAQSTVKTSV